MSQFLQSTQFYCYKFFHQFYITFTFQFFPLFHLFIYYINCTMSPPNVMISSIWMVTYSSLYIFIPNMKASLLNSKNISYSLWNTFDTNVAKIVLQVYSKWMAIFLQVVFCGNLLLKSYTCIFEEYFQKKY